MHIKVEDDKIREASTLLALYALLDPNTEESPHEKKYRTDVYDMHSGSSRGRTKAKVTSKYAHSLFIYFSWIPLSPVSVSSPYGRTYTLANVLLEIAHEPETRYFFRRMLQTFSAAHVHPRIGYLSRYLPSIG